MAEKIRNRSEIPDQYKWKLSDIYASDDAWKADYDLKRFSATDETFKAFHDAATYVGMDAKKKVIKYQNANGENCELSYGNL